MVLGTGGTTTARGRLRLSPRLRLRLSPTCTDMATDLDTTAMASATTVLDTGSTTARGKLRLSPRLPLIPTCCTDTATSMAATTAMDSATATATVLATGDTTMDKLL